jgi:tetratricopeptide (TPR) repeat protein
MQPQDPDGTATGLYAHADLPPGTLVAGRFRIEALLGLGGMGMVYRATDTALGVQCALKVLRPELMHRADAMERFRQELLLARQVSNPHVVRIHDLAQDGNRWLISMDLVEGESLDRRLDREGKFDVEDALRITRQLADGLAAAHARGVVHRDLKPANVLLDAQGNAYISDFGVARSLAGSGMTRSGAIVGTPDYVSPEQARGDTVDARSDLYSLGLILYEMLAGKLPFSGGTVTEVLAQRMTRSPPPLDRERPDLPTWVVRLVDRLLRPQPAHRMQHATDVLRAIDARAVPYELPHGGAKKIGAWVALLAFLALVVGGAWWWSERQRPAAPAVAAAPPLERVLLLPLTHYGKLPAARALAFDAHVRDALAATPGLAIVDGERTDQALRQLDAVRAGTYDIPTLRRTAAASRVLQPMLSNEAGGWSVSANLHDAEGALLMQPGPIAATPAAALQAWLRSPALLETLGGTSPTLLLPTSDAALDAYGTGLDDFRNGRLASALAHLQAATKAAPDDAALWLAQADAALAIGEQDAAYDAVDRGLHAPALSAKPISTTAARLRSRLVAAQALLDGDAPAAAAQWRAVLAKSPDDTEAELNLARALGSGGDFNAAVANLQKLTARDPNDPRAWFELGKFSILRGQARRAVDDDLVRALVLYKRGRNLYGEAETVNALGVGYGRLGQTNDAAEQYRKAVELRRVLGNRRGVATSLRNLANVLSLTGRYDEAQTQLNEARKLNETLGDRAGLAAVDNELGLLAEERGDYPAALDAFRRALQGWRQAEDAHGNADALNNIGFAHFQLGAYDDAQTNWQQAANVFDTLGEDTGRIRTQQNLGLLATARGRWRQARTLLTGSLARAEELQMPEEAAVSRRNLAELELAQGHIAAAIEQARAAGDRFREREDRRGESDAGLLHVQALLAANATGEAKRVLTALAPALKEASVEQQALAQLATAEVASRSNDERGAATALRTASTLAAKSGVQQLQLQVMLEQAEESGALDPRADALTGTLGNASLRLQWLAFTMQSALARGDTTAAATHYREALTWLRNGDSLRAEALHRLGAKAATDASTAALANERADAAQAAFRNALPPALRGTEEKEVVTQ